MSKVELQLADDFIRKDGGLARSQFFFWPVDLQPCMEGCIRFHSKQAHLLGHVLLGFRHWKLFCVLPAVDVELRAGTGRVQRKPRSSR